MLIKDFENPPAGNRPRPFWFFNGDMDKDEVRHQILEMKEKGLGGFFLCARQGLRVPYLSKDWLDLCKYCVDIAKENSLEVWLYDEYPYPSGMSGGEVTLQHPESKQKILVLKVVDLKEGETLNESLGEGLLVSALAYPVNKNAACWDKPLDISAHCGIIQTQEIYQKTKGGPSYSHNFKRYFTYGPSKEIRWAAEKGCWKVVLAFSREIEDFKYYGNYLDPVDETAVQCFIDTTYEPYKTAAGKEFGKTVKGMFGDETGYLGRWPWSKHLPEYFQKKYGYPLAENLGALIDGSYPDAKRVRYNYFQCAHEMLRDNYHKPLAQWCEKNKISYVTEVPSARMSNQMYSHVPGGDPCHDKLGYPFNSIIDRDYHYLRQNPKAISAMTRQFNRRDSIVEAFHSMGWTATLQDMKWQIDRLTLSGITLHNFHAYYYTLNGITKHDAPPSQFLQNPYWEYYKTFADYCARSSRFITETEAAISVAILHPSIMWSTSLRNPFHRFGYVGNDPVEEKESKQLIDDYKYICKSLYQHHIEYEDLDPEVMAMGVIKNGIISVGRAVYSLLIVPPIMCVEKFCFELILKFLKSGGKVIFTGLTPFDSIDNGFDPLAAFKTESIGILEKDNYFCKAGKTKIIQKSDNLALISAPGGLEKASAADALAKTIKSFVPEQIEIIIQDSAEGIISHCRESEEARFIMLASQNGKTADVKLLFKNCPENIAFYELDLETGAVANIENVQKTNKGWQIDAPLTPWSARIIAMAKPGEKVTPVFGSVRLLAQPPEKNLALQLNLENKLPVSINGKNVYRLEDMKVTFIEKSKEKARLLIDILCGFSSKPNTIIEHFKELRSGRDEFIRFGDGFGTPQTLSVKYPIDMLYEFSFMLGDDLFSSGKLTEKISLLRDQMGIIGKHSILINTRPLNKTWNPRRVYDQNNIAVDITSFLVSGLNTIQVNVCAEEAWHGLSDPMYLIGNFGVFKRKDKFVIKKPVSKAVPNAKEVEGFPFYSGKFFFETNLRVTNPGEYDLFIIELPEKYRIYECVELAINGRDLGARVFSPYIWQGSADILKKGNNSIKLTIANTLGNMLEGCYYDYEEQKTVYIGGSSKTSVL